jgi:hypothetical protein
MKRWKDINWLWVAGIFSVAYGAVVGSALGWSRSWAFFTTDPKLNEAGDFLAGVFAPLALIWLVAAVLTQRQELNETRDQFTENQKVVDAQLKTINSQNELLTLQHKQAVENATKAYRLSLFDKRFQIYEKFVKFGERYLSGEYDDEAFWEMTKLAEESTFVFDAKMEEWLSDIAHQVYQYGQFRWEHPLIKGDDGAGNHFILDDDHNNELREKYREFTGWIGDQFLPEVRQSRFWHFMNVSDQSNLTTEHQSAAH